MKLSIEFGSLWQNFARGGEGGDPGWGEPFYSKKKKSIYIVVDCTNMIEIKKKKNETRFPNIIILGNFSRRRTFNISVEQDVAGGAEEPVAQHGGR